jgi:hypothetical protein
MSPLYDAVACWIRSGVQLLLDHLGAQLGPVRFRIWYEFSGQGIEFTLPSLADAGRSEPRLVPTAEAGIPVSDPDDLAVLRLLAGEAEPLQAKNLARRLKVANNGTLRNRLARLRQRGLLGHESGRGYVLTEAGRRASGARPGEGPTAGR